MQPSEINSIQQLIEAWDDGEVLFTIEMGGTGYEQAIQMTMFEILRYMQDHPPDYETWVMDAANEDLSYGERYSDKYEKGLSDALYSDGSPVKGLGLSGAQFGAALSAANVFFRHGYREGLDMVPAERRIQVSRTFPSA